jgi:hypothetical protein
MFDETTIRDFYIRYATNTMRLYYEDVNEKHNRNIQLMLNNR